MSVIALALSSALAAVPIDEAALARIVDVAADGPGCAVSIIQDGRVILTRGYGLADLETKRPITPDTTFNVASMTKQFTGMAVALLIADGKLSESDDIRRFLPELKGYGSPIRIANLLNHSSGLRNHMSLATFQPGDHLPSHEEALRLVFRQSALNFAPGTRHQYESPNYVLLAEIVSRVSGMPYEQFLQQRLFEPLGMTATGFASPALARAYGGNAEKGWTLSDKVNRAKGSSGLLSSATDFAKWLINYDRHRVGGEAAFGRMLSTSTLKDGSPLAYRYGLNKEFDYAGVKGLTRISHGGQTAAYRLAFSYFPGRGIGDVVLCNHMKDANGIDAALVSALVMPIKSPQPASAGGSGTYPGMPAGLPATLAGTWYSPADDQVRQLTVKDGALALHVYGDDYPLRHLGGQRFRLDEVGDLIFSGGSMSEAFDGQARLSFTRLPAFAPQRLAPFAGTYRSSDVDGPVTLQVEGGELTFAYPAGKATLQQVGRDHFAAPDEDFQSVRFTRDAKGRVTGLTLTISGITRLRFARAGR